MAPNNALKENHAAKASKRTRSKTPAKKTKSAASSKDAFGAGGGSKSSVISDEEVTARGKGVHTEVDEFIGTPQSEVRCFLTGLMFVTRLPVPSWCDHHPGFLMRAMAWFPLLGTCVGAYCAAWLDSLALLWPDSPIICAILSCFASNWLTGCFHEDGLGDSFDGFGGGWTVKQILDIMKDSRIGTYGCVSLILYLGAKIQILGLIGQSKWELCHCKGGGPALLAAHTLARATSAPLIYLNEYVVDEEDRKANFYGWFGNSKRLLGPYRVLFSAASAFAVCYGLYGPQIALLLLGLLVFSVVVTGSYGTRVIGGVMGDFLGATICLTELAVYLLLQVKWDGLEDRMQKGGWQIIAAAVVALAPVVYERQMDVVKNAKC